MENIKETVKNVMQKLFKDDPEVLLQKTLDKKDLKHIKFVYFKKGVLGINVDSSTWFYHLNLQKQDLLVKLGKKSSSIKDIRFHLGETK